MNDDQICERQRAEKRYRLVKVAVKRVGAGGKAPVLIDDIEVGYVRNDSGRSSAHRRWSSHYTLAAPDSLTTETSARSRGAALEMLGVHYLRQRECQLLAELEVARAFARELWPRGHIRVALKAVRNEVLLGTLTLDVAAAHVVHFINTTACENEQ